MHQSISLVYYIVCVYELLLFWIFLQISLNSNLYFLYASLSLKISILDTIFNLIDNSLHFHSIIHNTFFCGIFCSFFVLTHFWWFPLIISINKTHKNFIFVHINTNSLHGWNCIVIRPIKENEDFINFHFQYNSVLSEYTWYLT